MAVVVAVSHRNPWGGSSAAASPFTHQCCEAPAEALVQHLSPAKDEGWKNYGTEQQVQTLFAPTPAGSGQAGASLPALMGLQAGSQGKGMPGEKG